MRFGIKHLLLLTTAWAVLITVTYLHAGVAMLLTLVGIWTLAGLVVTTLVLFIAAALRQKSHPGGLDRVIGRLIVTLLAVGVVVAVSGFMFARHLAP